MAGEVAKTGRGIRYSDASAEEVVRRTAAGESVAAIGKVEGLPAADTIRHWIETRPEFAEQMRAAREVAGAPLRGRPPLWCVETAEAVIRRVREGETLWDVCQDPALPCVGTIHNWKARHPEFKEAMDQAYAIRAERLADGGMKLAMTLAEAGWGQGVEPGRAYACDVMLRYVRWYAARLGPKRWAPRKAAAPEVEPEVTEVTIKTLVIGPDEDGEPTVYWIAPNSETGRVERVDDGKWPGVEMARGHVGGEIRRKKAAAAAAAAAGADPAPTQPTGNKPHDPEGWC